MPRTRTRLHSPAAAATMLAEEAPSILDLLLDADADLPDGWEDNGDGTANKRDVELTAPGTWLSMNGAATVTDEELDDVVAAEADPEVDDAHIRLGHIDPRFDGEPALGWVGNLARTDDGKLKGDLLAVPRRLAALVHTLYRRRSVGLTNEVTTPSGKTYKARLHHLALLGVTEPAAKGLTDVATILAAGPKAEPGVRVLLAEQVSLTEQEQEVRDAWRRQRRSTVGDEVDTWAVEVYPDTVIVEENGQHYRVGYMRDADGNITFASSGKRTSKRWVDEDDDGTLDVGSSTPAVVGLFAAGGGSHATRETSVTLPALDRGPGRHTTTDDREGRKMIDEARLRELRTIEDDAELDKAIKALLDDAAAGDGGGEGGDPKPGEKPDGGDEPPVTQPSADGADAKPELVSLSAGDVAKLQADAAEGAEAAKKLREQEAVTLLSAAIGDNRVAVSEHATLLGKLTDPDEKVRSLTRELIEARPKGTGGLPTTLLGGPHVPSDEAITDNVAKADDAAFGDG